MNAKQNAVSVAVADAVNAAPTLAAVPKSPAKSMEIIFKKAKAVIARPTSAAEDALIERGIEMGGAAADVDEQMAAALKSVAKMAKSRRSDAMACLKAGFVAEYMSARGCAEKSAIQKFDRLRAVHAPETSRKAKSNAAKGGAHKGKKGAKVTSISAKEGKLQLIVDNVIAYVKAAQEEYKGETGDVPVETVMDMLGDIAALAKGRTRKS
jgi:hypothetical protein